MSQDGEKLQEVVCNIKVLDPYHQASDSPFLSQLVVLPHLLFACSLNEFVCKKNKVHALLLFIFKKIQTNKGNYKVFKANAENLNGWKNDPIFIILIDMYD